MISKMIMTLGLASIVGMAGCVHTESSASSCCQLEAKEKKVDITCYAAKRESFCVPGPSCRGPKHCELVCDDCDPTDGVEPYVGKKVVWFDWRPSGAKVFNRTKLMRKEESVTVPENRWTMTP